MPNEHYATFFCGAIPPTSFRTSHDLVLAAAEDAVPGQVAILAPVKETAAFGKSE